MNFQNSYFVEIDVISERSYVAKDNKGLVVISLPEEYGIVRVVFQPRVDAMGHHPRKPRVLVSNIEPSKLKLFSTSFDFHTWWSFWIVDAEDGSLEDPVKFRECGQFQYGIEDVEDHAYTIVCHKCLNIGKYVTVQSGKHPLQFSEIAIFGIKRTKLNY